MRTGRRIPLILLACTLVAGVAFWMQPPPPGVQHTPPKSQASPGQPVAAAAAAAEPTNRTAAAPVCLDQQIEVTIADKSAQQCMGATHTVRNGSVLTYRVDPQNRNGQWLNIEAAGKTIVGAQLGSGDQIEFKCERDQCSGMAMSAYDPQGARSIVLSNATLFRDSPTHPDEQEAAQVTGQIKILPDDQMASTTCVGQALLINVGNETVHFCPDAGTGFDVDDDAGRTYRFTNGDGISVAVDLDAHDVLRHVEYNGYSCATNGCNGVSISAPDAAGARTFAFRGTMLTQNATGAALLNGNLILDPQ